jgi:hypothetical protein
MHASDFRPQRRNVRGFGLFFSALAAAHAAAPDIPLEIPEIVDARLQISLYADSAEIVTPIGAAVDARGRLFVLESHTHLAPKNYAGPKRDRIKIFSGTRSDGRAAQVSVFADDIDEGMNLSFAPDGTLHVITAKTVLALPDRNGDDRPDGTRVLLRLETEERYPHNQLLGLTISRDGWIYATRGNTGGHPHAWVGADGRRLEAYGNGGDIVRIRLDGSQLERFATGFWNPFDLKFDRRGRLLCVDNDPDSRGPNRLLHIVAGGDYGFKSLYGPSGLHPYNAWDGELPGTLPMVAGIGESPSAVLDLGYGALPADYRDTVAATIWADHQVSLVRPQPAGTSLRGRPETWIRGGKWFRPVALVAAPDGALYLTDWVLRDYPNHGRGRIWKITARAGVAVAAPAAALAAPESDPASSRLAALAALTPAGAGELRAALREGDPFVRHAAGLALAGPAWDAERQRLFADRDPALRLGALLAFRLAGVTAPERILRVALADADEAVRRIALMWAGETEARALAAEVDAAAARPGLSSPLFEMWLATRQILDAPPRPAEEKRVRGFSIKRESDTRLLARVAAEASRPPAVRLLALRRLAGQAPALAAETALPLARTGTGALRTEAVRALTGAEAPAARDYLRSLAADQGEAAELRAEAIAALGAAAADTLEPLLSDPAPAVRTQAARTLHRLPAPPAPPPAPGATAEWIRLLAAGGDPAAGARVFFSAGSTCSSCHRIDGRGGSVGPDLSVIARTADRAHLVRSIVEPSAEIAPQFQGWEVKTASGEVFTGLQGHWRTGGGATLILHDGQEKKWEGGQVASLRAMDESIMPEGLAALFSADEMRDLVAYLEGLK